jgi:AGCS family alanine or glycine:cation symporter
MGFCGIADDRGPELLDYIDCIFQYTTFYKIPVIGIPVSIFFTILIAIYLFFKLNCAPITLFKHSLDIVQDKYTNKNAPGAFTPKEAIYAAALGTVGLGSVGGMAVAIGFGGPGAVFWLIVIGIFLSILKFSEIALGHKFRIVDEKEGKASGGPFLYMEKSFEFLKMPKLGKCIGMFYAFLMLLCVFFSTNMFQCGQTMLVLESNFDIFQSDLSHWILGGIVVALVGITISGGLEGISKIANKLVPFMTLSYIVAALIILAVNIQGIPEAFSTIIREAFNLKAATGGLIGGVAYGALRSLYVTESGAGTSAISHSSAKTTNHIMEGCTGFIEVLFPMIVCLMTGLIVVVTKSHEMEGALGVVMTSNAFSSVASWFSIILTIQVPFLAITTAITWGLYGDRVWTYFFGVKAPKLLFKILFLLCTLGGFVIRDQTLVVRLADYVWISMVVPNVIVLFLMRNVIKTDLTEYLRKIKSGEISKVKTAEENK